MTFWCKSFHHLTSPNWLTIWSSAIEKAGMEYRKELLSNIILVRTAAHAVLKSHILNALSICVLVPFRWAGTRATLAWTHG